VASETALGGNRRSFEPTLWTVVLRAKDGSRDALGALIALYWKPVYTLIRRAGTRANEEAKDLTQEFFTRIVLEGSLAERYTPDKGTFRAYLKSAVRNFLRNEHRDGSRLKRGGDAVPIPLDLPGVLPDDASLPPEELFDRTWRNVVLDRAVQKLRETLTAQGKAVTFDVFCRYDLGGADVSYEHVARELGVTVDTVKNHLTRAREEFRRAVRSEVCGTVADPRDLSSELRELFGL